MVQWGGSDAFVAKNSDATLWHKLLHYFGPFCTVFRKATKRSRMHPNRMKHAKMSVYGAMGWIGCVRCEKFRRNFVAQTFVLLRPVLHQVSYGNQTVPNAPNSTKHTKTSVYGPMWWIGCIRCEKFRSDFVAQTFALARPVLHRLS